MEKIIKIKKAKLTPKGTIEAVYIDGECNEITLKGDRPASPMLLEAFDTLKPYLADIVGLEEGRRIDWSDLDHPDNIALLSDILITCVTQSESGEKRYSVITGTRKSDHFDSFGITSPKINLDPVECDWPFLTQYERSLAFLFHEVEDYIINSRKTQERADMDEEGLTPEPFPYPSGEEEILVPKVE